MNGCDTSEKNLNCFLMKQRQQMIQLDHSKIQFNSIQFQFGQLQVIAFTRHTNKCQL